MSHAKATEDGVVVETFNVGPGSSSSADATAVVDNKPVGASTGTLLASAGRVAVDNADFGEDGQGLVAGEYVNNVGGDGEAVGVSAGASVTAVEAQENEADLEDDIDNADEDDVR